MDSKDWLIDSTDQSMDLKIHYWLMQKTNRSFQQKIKSIISTDRSIQKIDHYSKDHSITIQKNDW